MHDIAVAETVTHITGDLMISKANGLSKWHPTARVVFEDRNLAASGCHCNGIVATWFPEQPDTYQVSLLVDGKEVPLGLVRYGKRVKFKLSFAWDGALKLEVGTGVATGMSSTPRRNTLELSCSTADVDFNITVVPPIQERSTERCADAAREQWSAEDIDRYCKSANKQG